VLAVLVLAVANVTGHCVKVRLEMRNFFDIIYYRDD